jgi:hypothetical protein
MRKPFSGSSQNRIPKGVDVAFSTSDLTRGNFEILAKYEASRYRARQPESWDCGLGDERRKPADFHLEADHDEVGFAKFEQTGLASMK